MKKIVTLVGFLFVSTGLAFAGVVSEELACGSSLTFSRGVGSAQTISCPGFTNSFGATDLIGATLELYADYQGGTPNQTNEVLLAFTIANPGTVTWTVCHVPARPLPMIPDQRPIRPTGAFWSSGT